MPSPGAYLKRPPEKMCNKKGALTREKNGAYNETPTIKGIEMDNVKIAKLIVNNMTGATAGAVTANIIKTYRNHSDNTAIELLLGASTIVTSFAVSAIVHDAVKVRTDTQIDSAAAWLKKTFKKTSVDQ